MTISRKIKIIVVAGLVGLVGLETAELSSVPIVHKLVSPAEARVGRPLTPVSVAGVARRTVRRCAVGVYYC